VVNGLSIISIYNVKTGGTPKYRAGRKPSNAVSIPSIPSKLSVLGYVSLVLLQLCMLWSNDDCFIPEDFSNGII
jgi:hypothetical protein